MKIKYLKENDIHSLFLYLKELTHGMKGIIFYFALIFFSLSLRGFSQPSNELTGRFEGPKKNTYSSFEFNGNGFVRINQSINGEYFHENDSLFIFSGVDVALYEVSKSRLKGISQWVKNESLKLVKQPKDVFFPNSQRAIWLKRYYRNNYFLSYSDQQTEEEINEALTAMDSINHTLCMEGLDLGCMQNFSYLLMQFKEGNQDYSEAYWTQLDQLANRVIALGNPDGYGLKYTYHLLRDELDLATSVLNQGVDLGSQLCLKLLLDNEQ